MSIDYPNEIQTSVFEALNANAQIYEKTEGAIFDHVPTSQDLPEIYVRIGDEQIKNRSSKTNSISEAIFEISIFSQHQGFIAAKHLSSLISQELTKDKLNFNNEKLIGIWFVKSQTYRLSSGNLRQIKLWFKALIEIPTTVEVPS